MPAPPDLIYREFAIDQETHRQVVRFLERHEEWHPWSSGRMAHAGKRKMRYRWGDGGAEAIPPLLLEAGAQALEKLRASMQKHGRTDAVEMLEDFQLDSLVVNRYHRGEGIGAHRDPPRRNPKVIGITLSTEALTQRIMRFRRVGDRSQKHDLTTHARSAYCFWGQCYTDYTHESVGSKRQLGTIYSLTFRPKRVPP